MIILCSLTACAQAGAKELAQGNQAFQQKDYVQALDKYQAAQKAAPDSAEPIYNTANVQYEQGAYDLAQARAEQALKHANGDLAENTHFNLGNSYFKQQQFDKAVEAYKQVLWADPNAADAKYNLELAQKKLTEQQQQQQQNQENKDQQNQEQQDKQEQQNQDNQQQKDKQDQQNQDNQEQQNKDKSQDNKSSSDQQKQADKDKQQQQAGQSGDDKQKSDDESQQSQVQTVRLTPEQARQLLESVARDAQSLPQFLQFDIPSNQPQQDW